MNDPATIRSQLEQEIQRCMELLAEYRKLGSNGFFGAIAIDANLFSAKRAKDSGNEMSMEAALELLRGCK